MPIEAVVTLSIISGVLVLFGVLLTFLTRYKKCPSDKIMVIYGKISKNKDGTNRPAKCIHGGAAFVVPMFQAYAFLDLTPLSISVDLRNTLSRQNIRIDVPSRFTVGISTEMGIMQNAAERLLGLTLGEIQELAKDIILGQLRLVIATMDIEDINSDRDKFLDAVSRNVEGELKKIGLRLINVNVTDISDESGYITALGKEAAAKAINAAKISVAEADKEGSIGQANALRQQRIQVSQAEAEAIEGENKAKADIANAQSILREREAEALRKATASENVQKAMSLQESYIAEKNAESERAARELATLEADVIVKMEIEKRRKELEAEADAEQTRRRAKGEADAIYAKLEAEARGIKEMLTSQAAGLKTIVNSAGGNPEDAMRLMITEKLETLVATQVEAIKNIKIDKITVWDSGANADGKSSTANFVSNLTKSIPPMTDLFNMAGLELPDLLKSKRISDGSDMTKEAEKANEPNDKK